MSGSYTLEDRNTLPFLWINVTVYKVQQGSIFLHVIPN